MFTGSNYLTHDNFTTFFAVSPPRPSARVVLMALQNVADASSFRTSEFDTHDLCSGGDNARLSSLPRHAGAIAALPRLRCRSARFAVTPCRTPRTDASPVAANGCCNQVAATPGSIGRILGKSLHPLRLYLSAAVRCARPRAFGDSAFGRGRSRRRNHECAPHAASAGDAVRQRSCRIAAHLRARCAE